MPSAKQTLAAIRRAKTVRELLAAIPQHAVGTAAMLLLCYLAILPPLASLTYDRDSLYIFDSDALSFLMSSTYPYSDHWYRLESTVIILSFLFVGYAALKLYFSLRDARRTLAHLLRTHKVVLFFGLLLLWAAASFVQSSHRFRSFFGTGYRHDGMLTYLFYVGLACMAVQLDRRQMRTVLEVFAAVGALLGLLCVFPNGPLAQLFYMSGGGYTRSVFLQRTHYGYYLSLCLPAGLTLLLTDEYPTRTRAAWLLCAARCVEFWLLVNSLVFNATRAAVVAVAVFLVVMNVWILRIHPEKSRRILLADVIVLAAVTFLNTGNYLLKRTKASADYAQELQDAVAETQAGQGNTTSVVKAANRLTSSRYSMWTCGIKYALQRPLFGWGPDNLGELYFADGLTYTDRPHNEFIQIAASLGFPALALYLCGLTAWLRRVMQKSMQMPLFDFSVAMIAVSYLVNSIFSNSMFYTTPWLFVFLAWAYKQARIAGK